MPDYVLNRVDRRIEGLVAGLGDSDLIAEKLGSIAYIVLEKFRGGFSKQQNRYNARVSKADSRKIEEELMEQLEMILDIAAEYNGEGLRVHQMFETAYDSANIDRFNKGNDNAHLISATQRLGDVDLQTNISDGLRNIKSRIESIRKSTGAIPQFRHLELFVQGVFSPSSTKKS